MTATTAHATLVKFGYPASCLVELEHWAILLRPAQATLGALVLCAKSEARALSDLPAAAFAELHLATDRIEQGLRKFRPYDKINYLALMMVDPHVHFHVLPRYAATQEFSGIAFSDTGFPGIPDLKAAPPTDAESMAQLHSALAECFKKTV